MSRLRGQAVNLRDLIEQILVTEISTGSIGNACHQDRPAVWQQIPPIFMRKLYERTVSEA